MAVKKDGGGFQRGFSLLETVLALALLGLVTVPLLSFFGRTIDYLADADIREKAVLLARDRLEELKAADFSELEDEVEILTPLTPAGFPEFQRTVKVSTEDDGRLKEVVITVCWDSQKRRVELKTRMVGE